MVQALSCPPDKDAPEMQHKPNGSIPHVRLSRMRSSRALSCLAQFRYQNSNIQIYRSVSNKCAVVFNRQNSQAPIGKETGDQVARDRVTERCAQECGLGLGVPEMIITVRL